jgi:putative CocE/NonD family hydrolase
MLSPFLRKTLAVSVVAVALSLSSVATVRAQTSAAPAAIPDVRTAYAKSVYRIPMRDGAKLYTVVYSPRDTSTRYPILLNRTPYSVSPYGDDEYRERIGPSQPFETEKYIFVYQDVRGRFMSEGEFENVRPHRTGKWVKDPGPIDESTDTYDTIDFLVKNVPNNNGRAGIYGISYPGFYAAAGAIDAHPALKAASPQAPVSEWFIGDDFHHNGAFFQLDAFRFFSAFGKPRPQLTTVWPAGFDYGTPDAYAFFLEAGPLANLNAKYFKGGIPFWNELMAHGTYDVFWKARAISNNLRDMRPAIMTVGGWFDAENLYGALHVYDAIERQSPRVPRNMLVIGPWFHGGWSRSTGDRLGQMRFGSETSTWYNNEVELRFFNFYLKDKGSADLPEAVMFNTGANAWREFAAWPPPAATQTPIYAEANGTLTWTKPTAKGDAFTEYVSDPSKPVPHTMRTTDKRSREYMVEDQRFASRRPDVLVFQTEPLAEDVTVAGPIRASLFASMTGTDADFIVKVIDVLPNDTVTPADDECPEPLGGAQMLLRYEVMRGKFRNSYETPEPFVPGKVTPVNLTLNDVLHTFRKGHRIMIQIQSSMFPLIDRNPQTFCDIYKASEKDFVKSTIRIFHSAEFPTHVTFGILK